MCLVFGEFGAKLPEGAINTQDMKNLIIIFVVILIVLFGFVPLWPHESMFGAGKINSYEFFGGCWRGDVRVCDYNPFD